MPRKDIWNKKEINILKKYFPNKGAKYCANQLNRTNRAVQAKAERLGIKNVSYQWSDDEINILKNFYSNKGAIYCSNLLDRNAKNISSKANSIGLKYKMAKRSGLSKKIIIEKLSNNKVISKCRIHGKSPHYYYNNKLQYCLLCRKEWLNKPENKERSNKHTKNWRRKWYKTGGCFRHLGYSSFQLVSYLKQIKKHQKNKCPLCKKSYNECQISVEHLIPLSTAKTEEKIIELFALKNLSLLCLSCNCSRGNKTYNEFKQYKESLNKIRINGGI